MLFVRKRATKHEMGSVLGVESNLRKILGIENLLSVV